MVKTGLYPGIADLLARLKAAGYKVKLMINHRTAGHGGSGMVRLKT